MKEPAEDSLQRWTATSAMSILKGETSVRERLGAWAHPYVKSWYQRFSLAAENASSHDNRTACLTSRKVFPSQVLLNAKPMFLESLLPIQVLKRVLQIKTVMMFLLSFTSCIRFNIVSRTIHPACHAIRIQGF
jgi:hypothetical protein